MKFYPLVLEKQRLTLVKQESFDVQELRNEAFRGLNFKEDADFLNFLEKHKENDNLQDLIELNCGMSVDEALLQGQLQLIEKEQTQLLSNIFASCNMFYSEACEEVAEFVELVNTKRLINSQKEKLTALEQKAVDIANYCDFNVYEITYRGNKGFILYDTQKEEFMGADWAENIYKFLEYCSQRELKNITNIISEQIYDDYGFDIDKVSNPNILTWKECNDEEMEDEKHNENLEQKAKKTRGIR